MTDSPGKAITDWFSARRADKRRTGLILFVAADLLNLMQLAQKR